MRSFFLVACFFGFLAAVSAKEMNYWDMTNTNCDSNDDCLDACKKFASDRSATLKKYGCTKCSGWFNRYCQCYVTGNVNDDYFMDLQTSKGSCKR
ncbi:hypothetical protein BC941DRAFT_410907 [Chlamydoabsidia padenii]|nr:hypothetical protein BC941DRAFT_410907 [Chlamydoabsidia padenii]